MVFVSHYDNRLDLNVWRACSAIRRVAMNVARVSAFTYGGQLSVSTQWPLVSTNDDHHNVIPGMSLRG